MVHEVTDESEFNSLLSSNSLVAVHYFASWNGPDKAAAPKFDEISEQHPGALFVKVDVDELAEVAETWGINCMPTFIVYKEGQVAQKIEGADFDRLRTAVGQFVTEGMAGGTTQFGGTLGASGDGDVSGSGDDDDEDFDASQQQQQNQNSNRNNNDDNDDDYDDNNNNDDADSVSDQVPRSAPPQDYAEDNQE